MSRMSRIGLALLIAAVGCGEDATAPQAKFVLTALSPAMTEGIVGSAAMEPTVRLTDRRGNPVANAEVRFDVHVEMGGGGSVSDRVVTTNADGIASAGVWTLSAIAGMNVLRVTTYGALTLVFRAEAKPDAPVSLGWQTEMENQFGLAGMTVSPPTVQVRDRFGNSIAGVAVTFVVTAGGGTLDGSETVTTSDGAAARAWTLGAGLDANTIRASARDLQSTDFTIRVVEPIAVYDLSLIDGQPLDGSAIVSGFIALSAHGQFVSHGVVNYSGHSEATESGTYELRGSTIVFHYGSGYWEEGTLVDGMLVIARWTDDFVQYWQYDIRD